MSVRDLLVHTRERTQNCLLPVDDLNTVTKKMGDEVLV